TVEVIVLDITGDAFPFQPAVVLLAAVSRIGGDIGRLAVIADMLLQVRDERGGVGCALVDAVGSDILVIGADLYIVGRFELAVSHVVLLHPHEGGIRIGLAIALAAFAKDLLLPGIALKSVGPPVFRIVQLLLHFLVNFGPAGFQRIVDFRYGILYLFAVDGAVARWRGVIELRGGDAFGIFPQFIQLLFDPLLTMLDGIAPHKRVPARIGLDLAAVGVELLYAQQPFFA